MTFKLIRTFAAIATASAALSSGAARDVAGASLSPVYGEREPKENPQQRGRNRNRARLVQLGRVQHSREVHIVTDDVARRG